MCSLYTNNNLSTILQCHTIAHCVLQRSMLCAMICYDTGVWSYTLRHYATWQAMPCHVALNTAYILHAPCMFQAPYGLDPAFMVLLLLLLLLLLVSRPLRTCVFLICVNVLKSSSAPRLHEVLVCYTYVFRLGQTPLFKTCFPCRRNTHLYMSLFATCSNFCCDLLVIITSC